MDFPLAKENKYYYGSYHITKLCKFHVLIKAYIII